MNKITYTPAFISSNPNLKDVLSVLNYSSDSRLDGKYLTLVNSFRVDNIGKMTNITIALSTFDKEANKNRAFLYRDYRANDFSCSSSSLSEISFDELRQYCN